MPRAVQVVDLYLGKIAVLKLDEQVIEDRPMQSIDVEPGEGRRGRLHVRDGSFEA